MLLCLTTTDSCDALILSKVLQQHYPSSSLHQYLSQQDSAAFPHEPGDGEGWCITKFRSYFCPILNASTVLNGLQQRICAQWKNLSGSRMNARGTL